MEATKRISWTRFLIALLAVLTAFGLMIQADHGLFHFDRQSYLGGGSVDDVISWIGDKHFYFAGAFLQSLFHGYFAGLADGDLLVSAELFECDFSGGVLH